MKTSSTHAKLLKKVDAADLWIDSRLPQTNEARARRKNVARVAGALLTVGTIVGGASALPVRHTNATVVVQPGDTYRDVLLRGQRAAAAENPHIDPSDPSYIPGAEELAYETRTNTGAEIKPGQSVSVEVTQGLFYGAQDVSADLTQRK
jgi:hypothetical protein